MDIPPIVGNLGAGGIVVLAVVLLLTGRLVPRAVLEQALALAAKETETWKAAFEKSEAARLKERELLDKAIEATKATALVVREFNTIAEKVARNDH